MTKKRFGIISLAAGLLLALICMFAVMFAAAEDAPVTLEEMIAADAIFDGNGSTANKLTATNGVVSSSGAGKFLYDGEAAGVRVNFKALSGDSLFIVLRGTADGAVWDGGHGYFAMINGTSLQMIEGAKEGTAFTPLTVSAGTLTVNIFDGEKHVIEYTSVDSEGKVQLSLTIDGGTPITAESSKEAYPVAGSHFYISHGQGTNTTTYKLYTEDGFDLDPDHAETDYSTITSKTMLKNAGGWVMNGAKYTPNEKVEGTRDQSIAFFNKELSNVIYSFDINVNPETIGSNWVAILLNANKADMVWNPGFRSLTVFIQSDKITLEFWQPQMILGSVSLSANGFSLRDTLHIEAGIYDANFGTKVQKFLLLSVNGKELYNQPITDETMAVPGCFGIVNFGSATYVMTATENEVDKIPSSSTGEVIEKGDIAVTNPIAADDFAIIGNSVNPSYRTDGTSFAIRNNGCVTYKNSVNFSRLSFQLKFDEKSVAGEYAEVLFGKKRQNSFGGIPLAHDATNYGYGLRIYPSGLIALVKTDSGLGYKTLMNFDVAGDFGYTFEDLQYHTFIVERELKEDGMYITVFTDRGEYGYRAADTDYYAPNYPMDGFISFGDSANGGGYSVREIGYNGTETDVASTLKAAAVNFATYFEQEDEKFIFVCFNNGAYTTKWVELYEADAAGKKGELIGKIFPGETTFDLKDVESEYVLVVSVGFTEAGNKQELVKLAQEEAPYEGQTARKIGIAENENGAYFVYKDTNERFVPMGANYMGLRGGDHSTFDAATTFTEADYDPIKAEAMFRALSANNGNVVRVFLIGRTSMNPGISGDPAYAIDDENYYFEGLYKPYMENVVDFLQLAQKYGVYVMLTLGDADVPSNSYYLNLQGGAALGRNGMYFTQNGINARATYAANVVKYLNEYASDCINAVFSVELQNEFAVYADQAPFNMTSGNWKGVNGATYDMGNEDAREQAYIDGVKHYINTVTAAIREQNADILVNEGTFTRNIVGNNTVYGMQGFTSGDLRMPATLDIYLGTDIDFVDIHIYFANVKGNTVMSSFADDLQYMNYYKTATRELLKEKCIFMGEFGPDTRTFPTMEEANEVWTETVRLATEAGFSGFAAWTLESHSQVSCWNLLADDGKFDLFRELVRIHTGVVNTDNVTAADVTVKVGETVAVQFGNLLEGDTVTYSTDGKTYSKAAPKYDTAGEYTLYYRVERANADTKEGSVKVTVTDEEEPTGPSQKKGCGSQAAGYGLGISLAVLTICAALLFGKQKSNRKN